MLTIHPEARAAFDRKLEGVASGLAPIIHDALDATEEGTGDWIEPYVEATLDDSNVVPGPHVQWRLDGDGEQTEAWITDQGLTYHVQGERFAELRYVVEKFVARAELRDLVGSRRVLDLTLEWIMARRHNKDLSASTYVIDQLAPDIAPYSFVFPVFELYVEKPFRIGQVDIRPVTGQQIEEWYSDWGASYPDHRQRYDQEILKWKKQIQGRAAAECTVVAERQHGSEVALDRVESALGMLRIFSKGALYPNSRSHCTVLGKEKVESLSFFTFREGEFLGNSSAMLAGEGTFWRLDSYLIEEIMRGGLADMSALLTVDQPTPMQQLATEALLLYSRCSTETTIEGKLIYLFAALESVLLRDPQEPIQDNIGHRMAYLLSRTVEGRKQVISVVKRAYRLRSRFFHHGVTIDEYGSAKSMMQLAWAFFTGLPAGAAAYSTKDDFVQAIEDRRLSG